MNASVSRQGAERRGRWAETKCVWWLRLKGYTVVARRYRSGMGEIDIVARRGRVLVFVEVKARPTFDQALQAIGRQQRTRIARAASLFIAAHPAFASLTMRYDVMVVLPWRLPRHVSGAWTD
jgi:putative endonuclease